MTVEEPGVHLEVVYFDVDMLELDVHVANSDWAGRCQLYCGHAEPRESAAHLRGFPTSVDDHREFSFGALDETFAGGGLRITFTCTDRAGHAIATVFVRNDASSGHGRQEATIVLNVEAAGIESFANSLAHLHGELGSSAHLASAT